MELPTVDRHRQDLAAEVLPRRCCSNALKRLAGLPDEVNSWRVLDRADSAPDSRLGSRSPLHTDEVLIALAVSAVNGDDNARRALDKLSSLRDCGVHESSFWVRGRGHLQFLISGDDSAGVRQVAVPAKVILRQKAGVSVAYERGRLTSSRKPH